MGTYIGEEVKSKQDIRQARRIALEKRIKDTPRARSKRRRVPSKKAILALGLGLLLVCILAVSLVGAATVVFLLPGLLGMVLGLFYSFHHRTNSRERFRVAIGVPIAATLWALLLALVTTILHWPNKLLFVAFASLHLAPWVFVVFFIGIGIGLHLIPNSRLPE